MWWLDKRTKVKTLRCTDDTEYFQDTQGFRTVIDFCKRHHLFIAVSPLCGLVPMRPRNGLEIIPGPNQPSASGRALSCSLDELGLKYLNHKRGRGQTVSHWQQMIASSKHPLPREQEEEIATRLFSCTVKHFLADEPNWPPPFSYQRPAASLTEHYSPLSPHKSQDIHLLVCWSQVKPLYWFPVLISLTASDAIHISAKGNCFATVKTDKNTLMFWALAHCRAHWSAGSLYCALTCNLGQW